METIPAIEGEVVKASAAPVVRPATPMSIIEIAIAQNADVDKLERLMAMQMEWEKNEARKAFHNALAKFKTMGLAVYKDGHVHYPAKDGPSVDFRHATLANVCNTIGPALSACGLSWRWETKREESKEKDGPDKIIVICVLSHELGHQETTELYAFPDTSGKKNSIQAIGSTVSYLQRYTLMAATGTATTDQDDDGRGADPQPEPEKNRGRLPQCSDEYFQQLCTDIPDPNNPGALKRFGIKSLVEMGTNTVEDTIRFLESKTTLSESQLATIKGWKKK